MKYELIQIKADCYKDQFDIVHDCWSIIDRVIVHPTGEYKEYQYYSEIVKNPIFTDPLNQRKWLCSVPTDFGCPASWTRQEDGKIVGEETWLHHNGDYSRVFRYLGQPVLEFQS